jgi:RNA polymerase sigma-70 factor, ECF subfamily
MRDAPPSEAELLQVLGEPGHESETNRFIDHFRALLFAVCYRILRHRQLAEDAVQEAWSRIAQKKDSYDGQHEVAAWLVCIARNAAISQFRKRAVGQKHTGGDFAHAERTCSSPDEPDDLDSAEQSDRLLGEICQLPVDQQAVLFLVSSENRTRPGLGYATQKATAEALDYRNSNGEADHNRVNRILSSAYATLLRRLSEMGSVS